MHTMDSEEGVPVMAAVMPEPSNEIQLVVFWIGCSITNFKVYCFATFNLELYSTP